MNQIQFNCRNCGAPVKKESCQYYGTEYGKLFKPAPKEKDGPGLSPLLMAFAAFAAPYIISQFLRKRK